MGLCAHFFAFLKLMGVLYEESRESQREYLGSFLEVGGSAEALFALTLYSKKSYEKMALAEK